MSLEDLTDLSVADDYFDHSQTQQKRQNEESYEMTQYNPFASRNPANGSWDAMCMDRMLTIKRPKNVKSGEIWITEAGFAETLSLIPLNRVEQKRFWKKFRRIQMMETGELNKKIVDSRQERLMSELVSQKSRLDVIEGGNINERGWWGTRRDIVEQTLRAPPTNKNKGFFGSVADGLFGSK